MINLENKNDVIPICPHCKQEIQTVYFQELSGFLGRRYFYFCPHCRSALGVSHRKGLLMG